MLRSCSDINKLLRNARFDWLKKKKNITGSEINSFGQVPTGDWNFFSVATWKNVVAKKCCAQGISKSLTYFFADGPSPLCNKKLQLHTDRQVTVKRCGRFNYNNTTIDFILQKQRKGKVK